MIGIGNNQLMRVSGGVAPRPQYVVHTANSQTSATSISLTTPGVSIGDLLLILLCSDNSEATPVWDNGSNKPAGFTLIQTGGDGLSAAHYGAFWKIADGTEGSTIVCPVSNTADLVGFCILVTGANTTNPIRGVGANYVTSYSNPTSHTLNGVAGSGLELDLGFYILAFDGGDGRPFAVTSGTGWVETAERSTSTSSLEVSGVFGMNEFTDSNSINVTISSAVGDGASGCQFRIKA